MLDIIILIRTGQTHVSVAGCLGYDVLVIVFLVNLCFYAVSVAGCLGYDVLENGSEVGELQL